MSTVRWGLVLGCGGAWSIAALASLQEQLAWDPRDAEFIVGTSAGAVLAALLGGGVSVDRLLACQRNETDTDCEWNHDTDTGGALPPRPGFAPTGARLAWHGLRGRTSMLTALCGLAPRGRFDMTPFRRLIDGVATPGQWSAHPGVRIMAVDTGTSARTAFGAPDAPPAALNDAVCASYGVPGWCPPVVIGGRSYIDGGVASPTSADRLVDTDLDEVVVLAPMASRQPDTPRSPPAKVERRVRRTMTAIVDREVAALAATGKRVIRLEPGAEDLQAIGFNMMDPARRRRVLETALHTTPRAVSAALRPQ